MRLPRRRKRPAPGEYPEDFTRAFVRQTLPTATPAEARSTVQHLRSKGWSEAKLAQYVLPYMPPSTDLSQPAVPVPTPVSRAWLDQELPAMAPAQIRLVVEELERRGWSSRDAALAVLPHLLPKLTAENAQALLAGVKALGLSEEEVTRLARGY